LELAKQVKAGQLRNVKKLNLPESKVLVSPRIRKPLVALLVLGIEMRERNLARA
jgi:hypothetical protein